mmetsp:Transcript_22381/g.38192  ORF Transcript_22381/g.38192 Transcript_22381/m.38192 type:complete len:505 (-) Transcript_22381:825-2339(-)
MGELLTDNIYTGNHRRSRSRSLPRRRGPGMTGRGGSVSSKDIKVVDLSSMEAPPHYRSTTASPISPTSTKRTNTVATELSSSSEECQMRINRAHDHIHKQQMLEDQRQKQKQQQQLDRGRSRSQSRPRDRKSATNNGGRDGRSRSRPRPASTTNHNDTSKESSLSRAKALLEKMEQKETAKTAASSPSSRGRTRSPPSSRGRSKSCPRIRPDDDLGSRIEKLVDDANRHRSRSRPRQQQQQHHKIEAQSQDNQQLQYHSGYYNDSRNQHYQHQHYQSQYQQDQYDSASTFSNNSADPPAASYTSLSHQNELIDREGYEVQYEKHSPVQSDDSDSEFSAEDSDGNVVISRVPLQPSPGSRSRSNPRDDRDTSSWRKEAIPEHSTVEYNSHQMRERTSSPHVDDSKSVISSGSDQSSDPPGASYKDTPFDRFPAPPPRQKGNRGRSVPPPPPRKFPSPQQQRYVSPQEQRPQQQRYVSPQEQRRISPSSGRFGTSNPSQDKVDHRR